MAFSNGLTAFVMARFAAGIGVGMASMFDPLYIAEVSPAEVRGRNVAVDETYDCDWYPGHRFG
jgi:MFS family permease